MIVGRPKSEIEERSKVIRQDFEKHYNRDELREQLYREQEGICAICKNPEPMQNSSVTCEVDHAISVVLYASFDCFSIEEACEHANARKNLIAAHVPCNRAKNARELESNEIVFHEVPTLTEVRIQELRDQHSELSRIGGRIGGPISGRKAVESGQIFRIHSLPQSKEAQRKIGRIRGYKAVETGHLNRVRTAESCSKGGRISGRMSVESGNWARIRSLPQTKEAQRITGRKAADSGQLAIARSLPQSKEARRNNGHNTSHTLWHVDGHFRSGKWYAPRPNPEKCALCAQR
jgi:5-methylcytosine-specific restriction endonuclease McrA